MQRVLSIAVLSLLPTLVPTSPVTAATTRWSELSQTADAITGKIRLTDRSISMTGKTFAISFVRALTGTDLADAAKMVDMPPASGSTAAIYRTNIAGDTMLLGHNALCGATAVSWLVLVETPSRGAQSSMLSMAVFSGAAQPVLAPAVVDNSKSLCGTYAYVGVKGPAPLPR